MSYNSNLLNEKTEDSVLYEDEVPYRQGNGKIYTNYYKIITCVKLITRNTIRNIYIQNRGDLSYSHGIYDFKDGFVKKGVLYITRGNLEKKVKELNCKGSDEFYVCFSLYLNVNDKEDRIEELWKLSKSICLAEEMNLPEKFSPNYSTLDIPRTIPRNPICIYDYLYSVLENQARNSSEGNNDSENDNNDSGSGQNNDHDNNVNDDSEANSINNSNDKDSEDETDNSSDSNDNEGDQESNSKNSEDKEADSNNLNNDKNDQESDSKNFEQNYSPDGDTDLNGLENFIKEYCNQFEIDYLEFDNVPDTVIIDENRIKNIRLKQIKVEKSKLAEAILPYILEDKSNQIEICFKEKKKDFKKYNKKSSMLYDDKVLLAGNKKSGEGIKRSFNKTPVVFIDISSSTSSINSDLEEIANYLVYKNFAVYTYNSSLVNKYTGIEMFPRSGGGTNSRLSVQQLRDLIRKKKREFDFENVYIVTDGAESYTSLFENYPKTKIFKISKGYKIEVNLITVDKSKNILN